MRSFFILLCVLVGTCAYAAAPAGPTVSELVKVLKSDASQKDKADACRELARVGNSEAVEALAALLPDEKLSHMARYALETIPSSTVDHAFREALGKLNGPSLVGVIGSVGVRRDTRAIKALAKLLHADNPEVADTAARSLGSIGTDSAAKALAGALTNSPAGTTQLAICEGLLRCAERFAADGDKQSALRIYDRLRSLPEPHQVRTAAWRGSILVRKQNGLPLLMKAIRSPDFSLFVAAARTAREMPGRDVTQALCRELPDLPVDKQVVLLQEFGQRADPAAMPALFTASSHSDPAVNIAAINSMASLATTPALAHANIVPPMLPVLTSLLLGVNQDIAQAAQNALGALPGREVDDAVLAMLAPGNQNRLRLKALELVSRRRMTSAMPQLFTIARGPDADLRDAAVKRIGELADPGQLPELLNLFTMAREPGDLEATEQALATASQRAPDPEQWAKRLAASWDSAPLPQKCGLVRVFSAIGGTNALQAVRLGVADPHQEVRTVSLRALGGWNNGAGSADLLEMARSAPDTTERTLALHGFLELAAQSDLPATNRLALCRGAAPLVKTDDQKRMLLAALGELRSAEALELIRPMLDEPALKEEACTATVTVSEGILQGRNASRSAPRVIEALEQVVKLEPKPELLKRAQSALENARFKDRST